MRSPTTSNPNTAALDEYEDRVRSAGAVCIARARELRRIAVSPKH
jgi:hypothetical protein